MLKVCAVNANGRGGCSRTASLPWYYWDQSSKKPPKRATYFYTAAKMTMDREKAERENPGKAVNTGAMPMPGGTAAATTMKQDPMNPDEWYQPQSKELGDPCKRFDECKGASCAKVSDTANF